MRELDATTGRCLYWDCGAPAGIRWLPTKEKDKPDLAVRLRRIEGQLKGIQRMAGDIGLLLPCNVIVSQEEGGTVASAVAQNKGLRSIASQVEERLKKVIDGI